MSGDHVTGEIINLSEAGARQLTDRIRTALDRVSTAWADLAERITEAYQRRADLALGYGSWAEYAEAELKPSEGLAADVRRQLVGMLSAQGMSPRAISPVVGVTRMRVSQIRAELPQGESDFHPEPESLDEYRGRILADAETTGKVIKLTGAQSVADPTPAKVVGLDGKNYTRPEPKENKKENAMTVAPSRLAMPQPPKYGGNRPKHNKIIANAVTAAQGLCIALDEIQAIDDSVTAEEADRMAADLSNILRSLKRIQSLLKKES